mmetsp:Transcript_34286/g.105350  ORF Transcript_34286/g.105350 Transcript_34286/m.105350 type:complete len:220 (-) Transcript_34286:414-1073(-)
MLRSSARMQPQDHMSTAGPYVGALNNSSGARYQRVTTCCVSWRLSVGFFEGGDDAAADSSSSRRSASFSGSVRARPKSQTLSLTGSTSNNMLAGFKSRWTMPAPCSTRIARSKSSVSHRTCDALKNWFEATTFSRSVGMRSKIKKTSASAYLMASRASAGSGVRASRSSTRFSCAGKAERIRISRNTQSASRRESNAPVTRLIATSRPSDVRVAAATWP